MPVPQELIDLTLAVSAGEGLHQTLIPQLQVVRSDGRTLPAHTRYTPSLCLVLQGEKEAVVGGRVLRFTPARYLVVSVDLPVTGRVVQATPEQPFLCLVLTLEPATVYGLVQELPPPRTQASSGLFQEEMNPELTDALLRLLRCLATPADRRILAPMVLREITYRLLGSSFGATVRQLGVAGSRTQRIAQAVERIQARFDQPLTVDEMASAAHMSPSAFHHHFKQVTTMSPLRYQKELRLQEARRLLSTEAVDAATAALRVGYESPSQFSREYARLFGLPPMSDLKRLRQEA